MSARVQVVAQGLSFGSLLTLVFVAAKLWDRIDWPWVWVCSPLWIPAGAIVALLAVLLVLSGLAFAIVGIMDGFSKAKRERRKAAKR